jgi:hypothetical protein
LGTEKRDLKNGSATSCQKEVYQISERSYYRWIACLQEYGLNRELHAPSDQTPTISEGETS